MIFTEHSEFRFNVLPCKSLIKRSNKLEASGSRASFPRKKETVKTLLATVAELDPQTDDHVRRSMRQRRESNAHVSERSCDRS